MQQHVVRNRRSLEQHSLLVAHALEECEEHGAPQHAWDTLDPAGQQAAAEDVEEFARDNVPVENEDQHQGQHVQVSSSCSYVPRNFN